MRPTSAEALLQGSNSRPRKLSNTSIPSDAPSQPMTFFLADQAQMEASTTTARSGSSSSSNFGVRSMESSQDLDALRREREREEEEEEEDDEEEDEEDTDARTEYSRSRTEEEDLDTLDGQSVASLQSYPDYMSASPGAGLSQPMTPVLLPSSQERGTPRSSPERAEASAPQFIMPQITMPSRRPFTEKGKRIGRLKILIAGDSGIGKTSLIKSIVQTCEDIVHVDPVASSPVSLSSSRQLGAFSGRRSGDSSDTTSKITEVHASTKPYPHWWSEIDESKVLRRKSRSGFEEQIIERNLCFVDTPGYGSGTSFLECIEPVVRYVESQFEKTASTLANGDGDLMPVLAGGGTQHVDIVFYVILHRLKPVDIEFMRRLSPYTCVLPVIAKADSLTAQQAQSLKLAILSELRSNNIRPFLFGKTAADIIRSDLPTAPFAISSLVTSDSENMDASVLMSPEYIPPLLDTELKHLVDAIFDPETLPWLKHATAKKYMAWRAAGLANPSNSTNSLIPIFTGSPVRRPATPVRHPSPALGSPSDSYALARIADHTQREERLAKVRLSRWAHDLQKSLNSEKERYERLARGERAIWLTERLNECVSDGQLIPISTLKKRGNQGQGLAVDARDPFGLVKMNETIGHRVLVMFKVASLGGLVGVVGVWVWKNWATQQFGELLAKID